MNGLPDISKYGTGLAETRKLVKELTGALRERRKARPEYATLEAPQIFTIEEAKAAGITFETEPPADWMLKVAPPVDGQESKISLITPDKWEILEDQSAISPEGKLFTREQLEAERIAYEKTIPPSEAPWTPEDIEAMAEDAERDTEAFYASLLEIGRTEETETLLKQLGASEEQVEEFFAEMPLTEIAKEAWKRTEWLAIPTEPAFWEPGWEKGVPGLMDFLEWLAPTKIGAGLGVMGAYLEKYVGRPWEVAILEANPRFKALGLPGSPPPSEFDTELLKRLDVAFEKYGWTAIFSEEVSDTWQYAYEQIAPGQEWTKTFFEWTNPVYWIPIGGAFGKAAQVTSKIPVIGRGTRLMAGAVQAIERGITYPIVKPLELGVKGIERAGVAIGEKLANQMIKQSRHLEALMDLPASEAILKGVLVDNWMKRTLTIAAKIPPIRKGFEKGLGWRILLKRESQLVEDIVARSAVVHNEIARRGIGAKAVKTWELRAIESNPVKYFGFGTNAYSTKMAQRLLPEFKGIAEAGTLEHIFTYPEMYSWKGMEKGLNYVTKVHEINTEILNLLKKEGVPPKNVAEDWWIHRVVEGKFDPEGELIALRGRPGVRGGRRIGAKPSYEMHRKAPTMAEGIAWGIQYNRNPEVVVSSYIEGAFKKIADARVEKYLEPFGVLPTERLAERFPEVVEKALLTKVELADTAHFGSVVNRAIRGEKLPEATLKAIERRFPEQGRKLRALVQEPVVAEKELRDLLAQNERVIRNLTARLEKVKAVDVAAIKAEATTKARAEALAEARMAVPDDFKLREAFGIMEYEDRLAFRSTMESQLDDVGRVIAEQEFERGGILEFLKTDPVALYHGTIRGKRVPLTSVLVKGGFPETFSIEEAQMLMMGRTPKTIIKGRVPRSVVVDELADHFKMTEQQLIDHIEFLRIQRTTSADLGSLVKMADSRYKGIKRMLKVLDDVDSTAVYVPKPEIRPIEAAVPEGWRMEIGKTRVKEGIVAEAEVDWRRKVIVFRDAEAMAKPEIRNHEIAHVLIEELPDDIKKVLLDDYVKAAKISAWEVKNQFHREAIAIDYGQYLTDPSKVKPAIRELFDKEIKFKPPPIPKAEAGMPEAVTEGVTTLEQAQAFKKVAGSLSSMEDRAMRRALGEGTEFWDEAIYNQLKAGKSITVYRAAPLEETEIYLGSRVTHSERSVKAIYDEMYLAKEGHIIKTTATADDLIYQMPSEFIIVKEKLSVRSIIPKAEAGMPEAGVQKDIFGYETPVFPKGKGEITQIGMDDYTKLVKLRKDAGLPPPDVGIKPRVEGIKGLEAETQIKKVSFTTPDKRQGINEIVDYKTTTYERKAYTYKRGDKTINVSAKTITVRHPVTAGERLAEEVKALTEARKAPYWQARAERAFRMEQVRQPSVGEGYIMQPFAGGRIYDQPFIDAFNKFFGHDAGLGVLRVTSDVAGILRITKAALDLSMMAIQGLPSWGLAHSYLLFNPPMGLKMMGAWYKAFFSSSLAFFDPNVVAKFMVKNEAVAMQRIAFGGSARAVDYFATLEARTGLAGWSERAMAKIPLKPYHRAETAFFGAGEMVRDEFWRILSPKAIARGQEFQLARFLDRITGIADSAAMGVPMTVRQLEQTFVWFAPNYTRACLTVVADIFRGGMTGAEARKALGGMIAAGSAMYCGAQYAIATTEGKSDDEAWNAVQEGFCIYEDPITKEVEWKPSARFMTLKVGNYNFGFGGFWYGLLRLSGNIMACINEVGERERIDLVRIMKNGSFNKKDNPFIYWWFTRASPFFGAGFELATGRDFLGYPIETPEEYAKYIATRFEPIWMEQGLNWLIPGMARDAEIPEDMARAAIIPAEIFGLRTFPEGQWVGFYDKVNEYIKNIPEDELDPKQIDAWREGKLEWRHLTDMQKANLLSRYPELQEIYGEAQADSSVRDSPHWKAWQGRIDEERSIYYKRIEDLTQQLLRGEIDTREYREKVGEAGSNYGSILDALERDPNYAEIYDFFDKKEAEGDKYGFRDDLALAEYQSLILYAEDMIDAKGDYDWDERDRRIDSFIEKWGQDTYDRIQQYLLEKKGLKDLNEVWIRKSSDTEKLGRGYWRLPYKPIIEMDEDDEVEGNIPAQYKADWKAYQALKTDAEREAFIANHPDIAKDWRAEYRQNNPEEDARLALWGYGGKLQSQEAYDLVVKWGQELGIPLEQMGLGLPPRSLINDYFELNKIVAETSGMSAETKLYLLTDGRKYLDWMLEQGIRKDDLSDESIEALKITRDWRDMDNQYDALEDTESRKALLKGNAEYRKARRRRDAYEMDFPKERIDDYVGYYEVPPKAEATDPFYKKYPKETYYEDDWYLQEHPEFEQAMVQLYKDTDGAYGWKELKDYSKVPTREVFAKYKIWMGKDLGKERRDYERANPDLDMWLHLTTGTDLETGKEPPKPEEEKEPETPFEEKEREKSEAERIREWLEGLK